MKQHDLTSVDAWIARRALYRFLTTIYPNDWNKSEEEFKKLIKQEEAIASEDIADELKAAIYG